MTSRKSESPMPKQDETVDEQDTVEINGVVVERSSVGEPPEISTINQTNEDDSSALRNVKNSVFSK